MADLIERQAAIDAHCELCGDQNECNHVDICPDVEVFRLLPSAQTEPLTVNFAREMDRETIEKLKEALKNAPVLIMAVNDSAQPEN